MEEAAQSPESADERPFTEVVAPKRDSDLSQPDQAANVGPSAAERDEQKAAPELPRLDEQQEGSSSSGAHKNTGNRQAEDKPEGPQTETQSLMDAPNSASQESPIEKCANTSGARDDEVPSNPGHKENPGHRQSKSTEEGAGLPENEQGSAAKEVNKSPEPEVASERKAEESQAAQQRAPDQDPDANEQLFSKGKGLEKHTDSSEGEQRMGEDSGDVATSTADEMKGEATDNVPKAELTEDQASPSGRTLLPGPITQVNSLGPSLLHKR